MSAPVIEVRLQALEVQPAQARQTHLGTERWDAGALERVLERFRGRFGCSVVFEAEAVDAVRTQDGGVWAPVLEVPQVPPTLTATSGQKSGPSPVRRLLSTPESVSTRMNADGVPSALYWRGRWRPIDVRGLERLSGGWWSDDAFVHEDYRGVLTDGGVLWLRRDVRDAKWRVLGWFD